MLGRRRFAELGQDSVGQHLAQLHTPLIETVHTPHHSLHEHDVLVQRDQLTDGVGGEFLHQQRGARPVPWEHPVQLLMVGNTLGLHLIECLAERKCFALSEQIGHQ